MDRTEFFANIMKIDFGVHDAIRARRRTKERNSELKELSEKATQLPPPQRAENSVGLDKMRPKIARHWKPPYNTLEVEQGMESHFKPPLALKERAVLAAPAAVKAGLSKAIAILKGCQ